MRHFLPLVWLGAGLLTGCSSTTYLCDARGPSDTCEIHHTLMRSVEIANNTSQTPPPGEYLEARIRSFVHSYPYFLPSQCRRCVIFLCDDCVRAEREWKQGH